MKPSQGKKTKRKSSDLKNRELLNEVVNELKRITSHMEEMLDDWSSGNLDVIELTDRLLVLNLNVDGQTVLNHLKDSHQTAVKELKSVLKSKSKFLNGLIV